MLALVCCVWVATAQAIEPSQTLTKIRKEGDCTVYTFNYPTVNEAGEPTVLSSALFAWTPTSRQETDSIESLHIFCHIIPVDKRYDPAGSV